MRNALGLPSCVGEPRRRSLEDLDSAGRLDLSLVKTSIDRGFSDITTVMRQLDRRLKLLDVQVVGWSEVEQPRDRTVLGKPASEVRLSVSGALASTLERLALWRMVVEGVE
jgi:hypothetical protein